LWTNMTLALDASSAALTANQFSKVLAPFDTQWLAWSCVQCAASLSLSSQCCAVLTGFDPRSISIASK
jgi:hypothetical protein